MLEDSVCYDGCTNAGGNVSEMGGAWVYENKEQKGGCGHNNGRKILGHDVIWAVTLVAPGPPCKVEVLKPS